MNRGIFIFRCVSSAEYFARHAHEAGPLTRELILFMRACGSCSSWAWHGDSQPARDLARLLLQLSVDEPIQRSRSFFGPSSALIRRKARRAA